MVIDLLIWEAFVNDTLGIGSSSNIGSGVAGDDRRITLNVRRKSEEDHPRTGLNTIKLESNNSDRLNANNQLSSRGQISSPYLILKNRITQAINDSSPPRAPSQTLLLPSRFRYKQRTKKKSTIRATEGFEPTPPCA